MEAHAKQRGEMAAKAFQKLDTNGDGVLSPDEFKKLGEHFRPEPKHKERPNLELQFKKLDTNKDGKLSGDEFKKVADAAFDKLDANHDGAVSAEELKQHRKEHGGNEHKP
jgi:Ca2+-binding EF-hand superfamily protein